MRKMLPALLATVVALGFSLWALSRLPDQVVTHWGFDGQPNGWSSARTAAFLLPGIMLLMTGILSVLPTIDPLRKNYEFHGSVYFLLANVVVCFMLAIHLLVLGSALGWAVPIGAAVPVLVGALFVFIGRLLPRMQPNWFMGIRTPWTLSSPEVWRKTHVVGATSFTVAGVAIMLLGVAGSRSGAMKGLLVAAILAALWPVVYSYVEWRREKEAASRA